MAVVLVSTKCSSRFKRSIWLCLLIGQTPDFSVAPEMGNRDHAIRNRIMRRRGFRYGTVSKHCSGNDRPRQEARPASLRGSVRAARDRLRCKSLLFGFQQEPGAGRDEAGATAWRLVEEQEALAEQERVEKHGAGFRVG